MERLALLHGTWRGRGRGDYPTIDAFTYDEVLRFEYDERYPMFHYEQRAFLVPSGEASHWESGFIKSVDGAFEISSAQDSGRVEVLRGPLVVDGERLQLDLDSVALAHDARLVRTRRQIVLEGDRLRYKKWMATRTTDEPALLQHLEAELQREA